ncbi:Lrp/AsnC family transcriptional regulator [Streptomyces chartreusis]
MSSNLPPEDLSLGHTVGHLDRTDQSIIGVLLQDGRVSVRALAEQVHISRANAHGRIGRMMGEGVISGFAVLLNPHRAGLGTSAYVTVTIEQNTWRTVRQELLRVPYIEHFSLVGGDFDVLILVRTPDNDVLRQVVLERIQEVPGVRSTRTWLVFEESRGRGAPWR